MPLRRKIPTITITKQKSIKKIKTNNQKSARIRRQRGYHWEDTIVKRFNSAENWKAFRLPNDCCCGSISEETLPEVIKHTY